MYSRQHPSQHPSQRGGGQGPLVPLLFVHAVSPRTEGERRPADWSDQSSSQSHPVLHPEAPLLQSQQPVVNCWGHITPPP